MPFPKGGFRRITTSSSETVSPSTRPSMRMLEPMARPSPASPVILMRDPIIIGDDFSMCIDNFRKSSRYANAISGVASSGTPVS